MDTAVSRAKPDEPIDMLLLSDSFEFIGARAYINKSILWTQGFAPNGVYIGAT